MQSNSYHTPVLLQSACDFLNVTPGQKYIDATFGGGGHTAEILRRGGLVLSIDQDLESVAIVHSNFTHLKEIVEEHKWHPVSGILFDLGVSSHQIDTGSRGFSFQTDGPLDMRMGISQITAADIVNQWPLSQLTSLLTDFGEIPAAKSLAEKIVDSRPLSTTHQLAEVTGKWTRQAFQALRIAVNDELGAINSTLPQALDILVPGGRLVVITFHSLEDRIVKNCFTDWEKQNLIKVLTPKPIGPETSEMDKNNRSKSAKLRAISKI
jgi:16S rRNA (cytosine1402-N4)-methyltransferase